MYLVVLYIFIRWKGRVTIIVTITFLRKYANLDTPEFMRSTTSTMSSALQELIWTMMNGLS